MNQDALQSIQAVALYRHGISIFSTVEAVLLRGSDDGNVQLVRPTERGEEEIFRAQPDAIRKVGGSDNMLNFVLGGNTYRLTLLSDATEVIGSGVPTLDVIQQYRTYKPVKIKQWLQRFKAQGIKVTYITILAIILWVIGSLAALFALAAIVGLLASI